MQIALIGGEGVSGSLEQGIDEGVQIAFEGALVAQLQRDQWQLPPHCLLGATPTSQLAIVREASPQPGCACGQGGISP